MTQVGHQEKEAIRKTEERLPPAKGQGVADPQVWFGLDDSGHRNGRNLRDLAKAIRQRDFAEAEICLDLLARDDSDLGELIALGRQAA